MNYFLGGYEVSMVLRSWEQRFGAVLYQLGDTTMELLIGRPPLTEGDARVLTSEHYLFCPDNFYPQDERPPVTEAEYAGRLLGAKCWDFWWD